MNGDAMSVIAGNKIGSISGDGNGQFQNCLINNPLNTIILAFNGKGEHLNFLHFLSFCLKNSHQTNSPKKIIKAIPLETASGNFFSHPLVNSSGYAINISKNYNDLFDEFPPRFISSTGQNKKILPNIIKEWHDYRGWSKKYKWKFDSSTHKWLVKDKITGTESDLFEVTSTLEKLQITEKVQSLWNAFFDDFSIVSQQLQSPTDLILSLICEEAWPVSGPYTGTSLDNSGYPDNIITVQNVNRVMRCEPISSTDIAGFKTAYDDDNTQIITKYIATVGANGSSFLVSAYPFQNLQKVKNNLNNSLTWHELMIFIESKGIPDSKYRGATMVSPSISQQLIHYGMSRFNDYIAGLPDYSSKFGVLTLEDNEFTPDVFVDPYKYLRLMKWLMHHPRHAILLAAFTIEKNKVTGYKYDLPVLGGFYNGNLRKDSSNDWGMVEKPGYIKNLMRYFNAQDSNIQSNLKFKLT